MKYMKCVYEALKDYFEGGMTEEEIDKMDRRDVLSIYLRWEGIIGYTNIILDILDQ